MNQTINAGKEKLTIRVHPNAPVVLNYHINGQHNKRRINMRFVSIDGIEWMLNNLNRFATNGIVWYVASDDEYIEILSKDYDIDDMTDIVHDYELCKSYRNNPRFVHMMDAYEMLICIEKSKTEL